MAERCVAVASDRFMLELLCALDLLYALDETDARRPLSSVSSTGTCGGLKPRSGVWACVVRGTERWRDVDGTRE